MSRNDLAAQNALANQVLKAHGVDLRVSTCPRCKGRGKVYDTFSKLVGIPLMDRFLGMAMSHVDSKRCPKCEGDGFLARETQA